MNLYKYYNPNLIRNHGNIKTDQSLHCESVKPCTTLINKNKSNTESDKELHIKKRPRLIRNSQKNTLT